ncbi:hypothetical protein, partial [Winogradskyella ouciana]|uniref:hypothetical protein n=1 Tax=Winogradskyella ouciana TaxID=2608631 RepID=UPI001F29187C
MGPDVGHADKLLLQTEAVHLGFGWQAIGSLSAAGPERPRRGTDCAQPSIGVAADCRTRPTYDCCHSATV